MICDECLHQWECWDQRGLCNQFKSKEELRKQIEGINQKYRAAERTGTNKGSIQKASDLQQQQAHEGCRAPVPVQTKAGTDPKEDSETEAEKEAGQRIQT